MAIAVKGKAALWGKGLLRYSHYPRISKRVGEWLNKQEGVDESDGATLASSDLRTIPPPRKEDVVATPQVKYHKQTVFKRKICRYEHCSSYD